MVQDNKRYINFIHALIDIICIVGSFSLAFYIRFYTPLFARGVISIPFGQALFAIVAMIPLYILVYNFFGLYTFKKRMGSYKLGLNILKSNVIVLMGLIVVFYIIKIVDFSRYVLILFFVFNIVLTVLARLIFNKKLNQYLRSDNYLKRCVVLGSEECASDFIKVARSDLEWGYKIVGFLSNNHKRLKKYKEIPFLGRYDLLQSVIESKDIDTVVIAFEASEYDYLGDVLNVCEKYGVKTKIIPHYYRYIPAVPYMETIDGLPMIDTRHVPLDNLTLSLFKRVSDVLIALVGLIICSPVLIISGILVKATSPGPIIYKQERVGLNRKRFNMYKFRSMKVQTLAAEKTGWTTKNDPRKTKWGSFMRKTSIDELPQLINVLKGEMSIVGPRPERPQFVDQFKEEIPKYMVKHQVRPGLTGWAQVNGWRGDTSIQKRIEYDIFYIENWTYSFDIKIILLTLFKGLINKNAY